MMSDNSNHLSQQVHELTEKLQQQEHRIALLEKRIKNIGYESIVPLGTLLILCFLFYVVQISLMWPYSLIGLILYTNGIFALGVWMNVFMIRMLSYGFFGITTSYILFHYWLGQLVHPYYFKQVNLLLLFCVGTAVVGIIAARKYPKIVSGKEKQILLRISYVCCAFFVWLWGRTNIIMYFDVLTGQGPVFIKRLMGYTLKDAELVRTHFTQLLLTIYYGFFSITIAFLGLWMREQWLRYLGFGLMAIALYKLLMLISGMDNTMYRMAGFLVVGTGITLGFLAYQRLTKKYTKIQ